MEGFYFDGEAATDDHLEHHVPRKVVAADFDTVFGGFGCFFSDYHF